MEFSFLKKGQRNECLMLLQRITGQLPEGEVVEVAGASAQDVGESAPISVAQMWEPEPEPEPEFMEGAVTVMGSDPKPQGTDDNTSKPIVARGYIYKKSRKGYWPPMYIVLKGRGIYIYKSEEEFLEKNSDQNLSTGETRIGKEYVQEISPIALKGFRESSTHDITSGKLSPIGIESVRWMERAKIKIIFDDSYTSADPNSTGNFLSSEITFAVLGYHDTVTEANNNSGETLTKMGHLNGTSQLKTDTGGFFKRPPFYVLLYNKIWEILNPGQGVHQYLDYSE